jgi:small subunit ribosomal protein S18
MAFERFQSAPTKVAETSSNGKVYVDYKNIENLRKMMSPNGKIYGRKRSGLNAFEQRLLAQAIKRARYMALLPYTSATL